jgi:hypothetical protein
MKVRRDDYDVTSSVNITDAREVSDVIFRMYEGRTRRTRLPPSYRRFRI